MKKRNDAPLCALLIAALPFASGMLDAQTTPAGEPRVESGFEVASVKPGFPYSGVMGGCHGIDSNIDINYGASGQAPVPQLGQCVIASGRLSHFIMIAWGMYSTQFIASGPDWIARGNDRYDIEAKARNPGNLTEEQLLKMLQALLADRFQLKLHQEKIEKPGFVLVVGKAVGKAVESKLRESTAEEATVIAKGRPHQQLSLEARTFSMERLASMLSALGPGPVVDKTGLGGTYDFELSWDDTGSPSLFAALQDQLGLQLVSQTVPVTLFVVDSAQKPDTN